MTTDNEDVGVVLEKLPGGKVNARLERTMRDATTMIQRAIEGLGYRGNWQLRPLMHVSPITRGKFFCSRVDPDGLRVRIQPTGNDSCWEFLLKPPVGTSPLALQFLKDNLKGLRDNGDLPPSLLRTPQQLRELLRSTGVSTSSSIAAAGGDTINTELRPGSLLPRSSREVHINRRRHTESAPIEEPVMKKTAPPAAPAADTSGHNIAGQLLGRRKAIAEFKTDMEKLSAHHAEQHVLKGQLAEAEKEVARIKAGVHAVDEEIRKINNKWPDPAAMQAEENDLKRLAEELFGMLDRKDK